MSSLELYLQLLCVAKGLFGYLSLLGVVVDWRWDLWLFWHPEVILSCVFVRLHFNRWLSRKIWTGVVLLDLFVLLMKRLNLLLHVSDRLSLVLLRITARWLLSWIEVLLNVVQESILLVCKGYNLLSEAEDFFFVHGRFACVGLVRVHRELVGVLTRVHWITRL